MKNNKHLIIVLGMHRSGTSFLCQILEQLGLTFPGNLLPANKFDNPLGYFEAQEVVQLNNTFLQEVGASWRSTEPLDKVIFQGVIANRYRKNIGDYFEQSCINGSLVLKDPRLCRLLPLWQPVIEEYFEELKCICIIRHPLSVVRSLSKRGEIKAFAPAAIHCPYHSLSLWLFYNLELLLHSEDSERIFISYESLVTSPEKYGNQISQFLNIDHKPVANKLIIDAQQEQNIIISSKEHSELHPQTLDYYEKLYQGFIHGKFQTKDIELIKNQLENSLLGGKIFTKSADIKDVQLSALRSGENKELIAKTHGMVNRLCWSIPQQRPELDVLFISHDASSRGHLYRVKHICDALNLIGVKAAWIEIADLDELKLLAKNIKRVVIFRCGYSEQLEGFISECRARNIRIIYDIDDFVFDTSVLEHDEIHFISTLAETERKQWRERFHSYRQVISMADVISVPTHTLQALSQAFCTKSVVFPNSFDPVNMRISDLAVSTKLTRSLGKTTIGYASGTSTHEHDFLTIQSVLIELLLLYPDLHIKIIGHLKRIQGTEFDPFRERIHLVPVVPHTALPFELVDIDINLIPLERNRFTDSKSELKYFEPALLKIPSVAVANPVYKNIIKQGQNGYLAADEKTWAASLSLLIESSALRKQIGEAAYNTAIQLYDIDKLAVRYKQDILGL